MKVFYAHWRVPMGSLKKGKGMPTDEELVRYTRSNPNFVPEPTGGATQCTYVFESGAVFTGECRCSRGDVFSYAEGRDTAEARAISNILSAIDGSKEIGYTGEGVVMQMPQLAAEYVGKALKSALNDPRLSRDFKTKLKMMLQDVEFFKLPD